MHGARCCSPISDGLSLFGTLQYCTSAHAASMLRDCWELPQLPLRSPAAALEDIV